jgi:hypothetical protein
VPKRLAWLKRAEYSPKIDCENPKKQKLEFKSPFCRNISFGFEGLPIMGGGTFLAAEQLGTRIITVFKEQKHIGLTNIPLLPFVFLH